MKGERVAKYDDIGDLLRVEANGADTVLLTFHQIAEVVKGGTLPASAYRHAAWWSNDASGHVQSKTWLAAGWRVALADLDAEEVFFLRSASHGALATPPPLNASQQARSVSNVTVSTHGRLISADRITSLAHGEIFVFGSNAGGKHGGGAARHAMNHFGAVYGQGHGLHGRSYAIDTMSGLDVIAEEVRTFLDFAYEHPDMTFLVTEIGTGIAGFKPEQIAPLFTRVPPNVALPRPFVDITEDPRSEWTLRIIQLRARIYSSLEAELEDSSLFYPPGRLEADPLWDSSDLQGTEARAQLLLGEMTAGNPLVTEFLRLRNLAFEARTGTSALSWPAASIDEIFLRSLFEQQRDEEIFEWLEAQGGIQMGTSAWAEQLGWIAESRARWARGEDQCAIDCLLLALEHSPGPWGEAEPDVLLRGLCDLAFLAAPWLGGLPFRSEIAKLAQYVAHLVKPWRGKWFDGEIKARLRALER